MPVKDLGRLSGGTSQALHSVIVICGFIDCVLLSLPFPVCWKLDAGSGLDPASVSCSGEEETSLGWCVSHA